MHPSDAVPIPWPNRNLDVVAADGAIIRVRQHGNPAGPRLVMSHGNGLAIDAYLPFWGPLRDRYEMILFDFRNHGENPVHGGSGHDMKHFVADMELVLHTVEHELGRKPVAGVFHSLSALTGIRHALEYPDRWRALVLFDPPIYPRTGHPLANLHQSDKDSLASRARRRTERYRDPSDFARQLASIPGFKRWLPEAYSLFARASLRFDRDRGDWVLACPRELEARVFEENRDPTLWPRLAQLKSPLKLICGDPHAEGAGPPALIGKAIAEEIAAVEYESIPDTTHFLQIERPEPCVRAMESFLRKHGMSA